MCLEVYAVTFDDFGTLRFSVGEKEDIIYPILRSISESGISLREEEFLNEYFKMDASYRKELRETLRESLLDEIVADVLESLRFKSSVIKNTIKKAVDQGLATRKTEWYQDAPLVLSTLRKKGYKLGLISNTHWRFLDSSRKEMEEIFDAVTLSYEHGYTKPHPSIFLATLKKLQVSLNRCLHVGDDPVADIEGAKNVGMKTVFIKRKGAEADADVNIERLSQLLELLKKK